MSIFSRLFGRPENVASEPSFFDHARSCIEQGYFPTSDLEKTADLSEHEKTELLLAAIFHCQDLQQGRPYSELDPSNPTHKTVLTVLSAQVFPTTKSEQMRVFRSLKDPPKAAVSREILLKMPLVDNLPTLLAQNFIQCQVDADHTNTPLLNTYEFYTLVEHHAAQIEWSTKVQVPASDPYPGPHPLWELAVLNFSETHLSHVFDASPHLVNDKNALSLLTARDQISWEFCERLSKWGLAVQNVAPWVEQHKKALSQSETPPLPQVLFEYFEPLVTHQAITHSVSPRHNMSSKRKM